MVLLLVYGNARGGLAAWACSAGRGPASGRARSRDARWWLRRGGSDSCNAMRYA